MDAAAWWALLGLGAFHGLNPAMGWLFAVAIGLQERRRTAVFTALIPIAAGHLAAIGLVAVAVSVGASVFTTQVVGVAGGVLLVGFGLWHLLSRRHFRWLGMRLGPFQLAAWSFLVASVHGAGLMLVPVLVRASGDDAHGDHAHHGEAANLTDALAATAGHTAAMLVVAGVVAYLVYEIFGTRILRSVWVDLDRIWAVALLAAGVFTLVAAVI